MTLLILACSFGPALSRVSRDLSNIMMDSGKI